MDAFDVVVLGGGTGGYTAAIRATQLGLKTAIVERDKLGGVCLHKGCIPTKLLLEGAETLALVRRGHKLGIEAEGIRLDYSTLNKRKQEVVEGLHRNLRNAITRKHNIPIIAGQGRLTAPTRIDVDGRTVEAHHVIIATGSRPKELPGLPTDGDRILNSDHFLEMAELPRSIVVIGAGSLGVEFASFCLDVGCHLTLVEMMPHLLPLEDRDLGLALARLLEQRGASVFTSARILPERTRIYDDRVELMLEHGGQEKAVGGQKVLVAVGRQGNVEDMGLENTRVGVDGGFIQVDDHLRTGEPNIFAVGDVIGGLLLAHVAAAEGLLAAETIAGRDPHPLDYQRVPRVTYSRPQVAAVGLSEEEAKQQGHRVKAHRFSLRYNAMARVKGEPEGFVKVVADADSGDLLGVHILAASAAELIAEAALAKWLEASVWELGTSIRPHPSLSEALGEAAQLSAGISIYW